MGTLIIGTSILVVGVLLYLAFKPDKKVDPIPQETKIPVESIHTVDSETKAVVTVKPVTKRVTKKKGIDAAEGVGVKDTGGEAESK